MSTITRRSRIIDISPPHRGGWPKGPGGVGWHGHGTPPVSCTDSPLKEGAFKGIVMSLKYDPKLIPLARELRREMTPEEKHLWYDFLCKYKPRFQRQKTIDSFIADFYCHKAKLIVEVDGYQHTTGPGKEYDQQRTEILEKYGLKVFRVSNQLIHDYFNIACRQIDSEVKKRL